ncbi:UDP-glucuronosyltransferase [Apodemus speciosus]|uniref:UDP-glucuronosyltransferase n=1 Tax=Apodemus speciosus TaxID=105296 RepID=A0ABQ0ERW4_APOSI
MRCHTQVLGSFVTHDKLDPEDSSVQGLHWLIVVDS